MREDSHRWYASRGCPDRSDAATQGTVDQLPMQANSWPSLQCAASKDPGPHQTPLHLNLTSGRWIIEPVS